jgi:hypothetical protein
MYYVGDGMKYYQYLKYVWRHKWFVFVASRKLGITWLGIIHDWSKLLPSEFLPYMEYFYGKDGASNRESSKDVHHKGIDDAFDAAWNKHKNRNKHHWQWWILQEDNGPIKILPMEEKYILEMIADWTGAGMAISGRKDWRPWYATQRETIQLHPETRDYVEELYNE